MVFVNSGETGQSSRDILEIQTNTAEALVTLLVYYLKRLEEEKHSLEETQVPLENGQLQEDGLGSSKTTADTVIEDLAQQTLAKTAVQLLNHYGKDSLYQAEQYSIRSEGNIYSIYNLQQNELMKFEDLGDRFLVLEDQTDIAHKLTFVNARSAIERLGLDQLDQDETFRTQINVLQDLAPAGSRAVVVANQLLDEIGQETAITEIYKFKRDSEGLTIIDQRLGGFPILEVTGSKIVSAMSAEHLEDFRELYDRLVIDKQAQGSKTGPASRLEENESQVSPQPEDFDVRNGMGVEAGSHHTTVAQDVESSFEAQFSEVDAGTDFVDEDPYDLGDPLRETEGFQQDVSNQGESKHEQDERSIYLARLHRLEEQSKRELHDRYQKQQQRHPERIDDLGREYQEGLRNITQQYQRDRNSIIQQPSEQGVEIPEPIALDTLLTQDGLKNIVDTNDLSPIDSDGDGISDIEEQRLETNPLNQDTDGDGLKDGEELLLELDPTQWDDKRDSTEDFRENHQPRMTSYSPSAREMTEWMAAATFLGAEYQDKIKSLGRKLVEPTQEKFSEVFARDPDYKNSDFSISREDFQLMKRDIAKFQHQLSQLPDISLKSLDQER